jgi:photosystem II stability/assembly factor-like uncharacterized protein
LPLEIQRLSHFHSLITHGVRIEQKVLKMLDLERKSSGKQQRRFLKMLLALVAVVLLSAPPVMAENNYRLLPAVMSPRASGSFLLDVTRAGERLVAVGERGHILLSDDNGLNWRQSPVPVSVTLTAVHFPSEKKGWAVGHDGVVLHSLDGGENWTVQFDGAAANQVQFDQLELEVAAKESALSQMTEDEQEEAGIELENLSYALDDARYSLEEGTTNPFLDVVFLDENIGFIVGAYGMIFRTDDGGDQWQSWYGNIYNPDGFHHNAISASGESLFMAGEAGMLYRSIDKGQSWENLESPYVGSFFGIVSNQHGKEVVALGLRGNAFRSIDGGDSWQQIETDVETPFSGGVLLSDGRLAIASRNLLISAAQTQKLSATKVRPSAYSSVTETADGQLLLVGLHGIKRVEKINFEGEDK